VPPERSCRGERADGTACRAPGNLVDPETGFCPSHDPKKREKVLEAARKGGKATARKLKRKGLDPDELPPLDSPQAAERWLEEIGRAVSTGRLGHHEATAAVRAVREWLRAHSEGEVAEEVEELRKLVEDVKAKRGLEVVP